MHNLISVSVVIPAYNCENYIRRAIDSVLMQTRPADQIIVIDDGSKDKTADIVRTYGDKVILIQQENAGVSIARNAGIAAATGDWIAFLDADDEWLAEKLKLQTEHLKRHPDLKWTFGNLLWPKSEKGGLGSAHPAHTLPQSAAEREFFEDYFDGYCRGFYAWTGTVMVHRSVFEAVGLFEPGMKRGQDNDLWDRIAYQYPRVGYLAEPLAIYHLDTPASSTKINDRVDFMIDLVHRHEALSKKYNRCEAFRPCITYMLQTWIRQLRIQKRYADVKLLLNRFDGYLSGRFRREMRFRLVWPPLTDAAADAVMRFKKVLFSDGRVREG